MNSGAGDTTQLVPGYPIRTPWDHSSVDNSPRPIAASHVLHRPLVPRHPPSALSHLTTKTRCSHPLYKSQQTTPTTSNHTRSHQQQHHKQPPTNPTGPDPKATPQHTPRLKTTGERLFAHNPTGCPDDPHRTHTTPPMRQCTQCSLERR